MSYDKKYGKFIHIRSGCFGRVFKTQNMLTNQIVAIKKIDISLCKMQNKKNIYREICILCHINSRYCIYLLDIYSEITNGKSLELCLVLPYMDYDLFHVIFSKEFNLRYYQIIKIVYQLIMGLKYFYNSGIIHRDLKPSNIGINRNLDVKILDFGLARDMKDDLTTKSVITRWYRPLEIFYTSSYTFAVDMWSVGCITVELFTQEPLFKSKDDVDQVKRILSIMGFPDNNALESISEDKMPGINLFRKDVPVSCQLEKFIEKDLKQTLLNDEDANPDSYADILKLIYQMLDLNPVTRITPMLAKDSAIFLKHKCEIVNYLEDPDCAQFLCDEHLNNHDSEEDLEKKIMGKINDFNAKND